MEQNYLPLFRKYRPQSFKDIVGQPHLVKALSNAIELNRIANAYLFCGPRGTGKTSSARILAKSLNCEHGPTLEPCQKCASCRDITNTTGLDVIEIDAASNRGIQDAKELIAQAQYAPINGKYKIFIIDEVHMLSNDAFNALLKIFEEPPENVIFILATTEPHKVLETIVSRCQRFDLRRITTDDIVKRLREIADLEKIKITDNALFTIAKNVSGGLRDSLALLDQVSILGVREEIDKDLIEELLGKINFDTLLNLLDSINKKDIEKTLLNIDEIYAKGNEPRNLAENFIEFLRNATLVLNSKSDEAIINFTNLIKEDIEKIRALGLDKDRVLEILNILIEYYKEIKISTNPYLWMELAGIAACEPMAKEVNIVQAPQNSVNIVKPTPKVEVKAEAAPAPKAYEEAPKPKVEAVQPPKVSEAAPIPTSTLKIEPKPSQAPQNLSSDTDCADLWANILANISSIPSKTFYANIAKLVGVKDDTIILGFLHEGALTQAKSQNKISQLSAAIAKVSSGYKFEFIKIDENTKTIEVKPLNKIQAKPQAVYQAPINQTPPKEFIQEESYEKDDSYDDEEKEKDNSSYSPKVQEMIKEFNGRIIE